LQSEVAVGIEKLRKGRRRGIKFDVVVGGKRGRSRGHGAAPTGAKPEVADGGVEEPHRPVQSGHCIGCGQLFVEDESETLVGFACGHVYHLSHLLHDPASPSPPPSPPAGAARDPMDEDGFALSSLATRTVGPKVTNARLLRDKIEAVGGCRVCGAKTAKKAEV